MQGFLYGGAQQIVAELDGSNNVVSRFVYAGGSNVPDLMLKGGATYRILTDPVGSVRLVVDAASGAVAQRLDYDGFGSVVVDTNPGFQPFGFAGGLYDPDTGLVRFGARDYDAQTGRWTAKDPIRFAGGDPNLYAYAANDPVDSRQAGGEDVNDLRVQHETAERIEARVRAELSQNPGADVNDLRIQFESVERRAAEYWAAQSQSHGDSYPEGVGITFASTLIWAEFARQDRETDHTIFELRDRVALKENLARMNGTSISDYDDGHKFEMYVKGQQRTAAQNQLDELIASIVNTITDCADGNFGAALVRQSVHSEVELWPAIPDSCLQSIKSS